MICRCGGGGEIHLWAQLSKSQRHLSHFSWWRYDVEQGRLMTWLWAYHWQRRWWWKKCKCVVEKGKEISQKCYISHIISIPHTNTILPLFWGEEFANYIISLWFMPTRGFYTPCHSCIINEVTKPSCDADGQSRQK